MSELEDIRQHIGCSKPVFVQALGVSPTRVRMLTGARQSEPILLQRARQLRRYYDEWQTAVMSFRYPPRLGDYAAAIGVSVSKLYRLRNQGLLCAARDARVHREDIEAMFQRERELRDSGQHQRSPFAPIFFRWLHKQHPEFFIEVAA